MAWPTAGGCPSRSPLMKMDFLSWPNDITYHLRPSVSSSCQRTLSTLQLHSLSSDPVTAIYVLYNRGGIELVTVQRSVLLDECNKIRKDYGLSEAMAFAQPRSLYLRPWQSKTLNTPTSELRYYVVSDEAVALYPPRLQPVQTDHRRC